MRLAHIILAHTEPKQVERLLKRISHPDADTYIHLDKKTNMRPFEYLKKMDNVYFTNNRVKVYWGTYTIVQATLNVFRDIVASGKSYHHVNLLSGQDYPLKPANYIHQYLEKNIGVAYINHLLFEPDWREAIPRIDSYHFNNFKVPGRYILQRLMNKLLPKRSFPNNLIPVGRSQWFTIPLECVVYLLEYWEKYPNIEKFIRLTWAPDEFIFHTILYNSEYKNKMASDDLRYIDWSRGGVNPKTLNMSDADKLISSPKLYARKFDMHKDPALLDLIDEKCLSV
jgi:hypothetical protein